MNTCIGWVSNHPLIGCISVHLRAEAVLTGEFSASAFNIVTVMIDQTLRLVVITEKIESLTADVYFQIKFVQLFI